MECPKCKNVQSDELNFCENCGANLKEVTSVEEVTPASEATPVEKVSVEQKVEAPKPQKKSNGLIVAILIIVLIACLGAVAYFLNEKYEFIKIGDTTTSTTTKLNNETTEPVEETTTTTSASTTSVNSECKELTASNISNCGYTEIIASNVTSNTKINISNEFGTVKFVKSFVKAFIDDETNEEVEHTYELVNGSLIDSYKNPSTLEQEKKTIFENVKYASFNDFDSDYLGTIVTNNNDVYSIGASVIESISKDLYKKVAHYDTINNDSLYYSNLEGVVTLYYNNTSKSCLSKIGESVCLISTKKAIKYIDGLLTIYEDDTVSINNKISTSKIKAILEEDVAVSSPGALFMEDGKSICLYCSEMGKSNAETSVIYADKTYLSKTNEVIYVYNDKLYESIDYSLHATIK